MHRLLLAAAVLATPAMAGERFRHQSGDLRAYFADWLAVCSDGGAGSCHVVRASADPGSNAYFDMLLAAHRVEGSADWAVAVPAGAWTRGDMTSTNVSDTVLIRNSAVAGDPVARMKPAARVVVTYALKGDGDGVATFPLRGVTAAMNAVEARVLARQE